MGNHYRGLECSACHSGHIASRRATDRLGVLANAEEVKRAKDLEAKKRRKAERKVKRAGQAAAPSIVSTHVQRPDANMQGIVAATPVAFVFPGQGSQAVGMLQVGTAPSHSPTWPHLQNQSCLNMCDPVLPLSLDVLQGCL